MKRIPIPIAAWLVALAALSWFGAASAQAPAPASAPAPAQTAASAPGQAPGQAPAQAARKPATAASAAPGEKATPGTEYSAKGADTCLDCHDKEADTLTHTTNDIFKSRHGQRRDPKVPFGPGGLQCEACHGPGHVHSTKGSQEKLTINSQRPSSFMPPAERNAPCLVCHENRSRTGWHAAAHERSGLACGDCHQMHTARDKVLAKATQADVCYRCHQRQRADFLKTSAHPVRYGLMTCADCHNAHGGAATTAALVKPTVNQTCTNCHADKRGPLLWEHAPVAEDCLSCHTAHGAVRANLLTKSTPLLCQQCHSVAGHPAVARTGAALPGGGSGGAVFLLAGSCTNCHSQVHGSNHPAGAKLMR
ncbi:MAG: DmsE family decaheme c-type cytochrome [Rubrivivax sp.]|nr:DmsE family decaheme c-type cytochrome [Rubrivivax sp.]